MGFLMAAGASISSVLGDQWKEYFYCSDMGNDILVRKGEHHTGKSGLLNRGGADNIITSGSTIVVNEGQCAIIVDQGAIVDVCAEPGAFTYEAGSPSIFSGSLGESIKESFNRFKYGGVAPRDQRIYYFNIKDIIGNKYGTASPVPFRVVDRNIGLDVDITIKCFGEYSFRLADPILFYKNISGNVATVYTKDQIASQLKSELLTQLQPAFAQISEMGIRYSALPGHADDLARILNDLLSDSWGKTYGIQIVTFGVNSVKAPEEDEKMIKELQKTAVYGNAQYAAGATAQAYAQAMQDAAKNPNGAMMGFAGLNMAQGAGGMATAGLFNAAAQQQAPQQAAPQQAAPQMVPAGSWTCPNCGATGLTGKFCGECGTPRPAAGPWTCPTCGTEGLEGKFCPNCGTKRP